MATNPSTVEENQGRTTPGSPEYPYGSAQDDTTGTAGDGTPLKKALFNDTYGFHQYLLTQAGIVPSGVPETVNASDLSDSLDIFMRLLTDKVSQVDAEAGTDDIDWMTPQKAYDATNVFGLGSSTPFSIPTDGDALDTNGFYAMPDTWTGSPFAGTDAKNNGQLIHQQGRDGIGIAYQMLYTGFEILGRENISGVWGPWDAIGVPAAPDSSLRYTEAIKLPGVIYTNTTGRPLFAYVAGYVTGANTAPNFKINGVDVLTIYGINAPSGVATIGRTWVSFIIPAGQTYEFPATMVIDKYAELI
jgi:hypothetical protein